VATVSLVSTAAAHSAPDPLDVETQLLQDEEQDAFFLVDGYDLANLYVREAHWTSLDQDGLVFRFTLYGGQSPVPSTADNATLDIEIHAEGVDPPIRLTTDDDANWRTQAEIVALNVTPSSIGGVTARMQAFVPYEHLNLSPNGTLATVSMDSYADGKLVDEAPGGYYLPQAGDTAEVPPDPAESHRLVDAYELNGTGAYVDVSTTVANGTLALEAENTAGGGQHVEVTPQPTPGWNVRLQGPSAVSLAEANTTTFHLDANASSAANRTLPVEVVTDLGGREVVHLGLQDGDLTRTRRPETVSVEPQATQNDSPGVGAVATVIVGLASTLALAAGRS
jgi:hypothetical protein